MYERVNAEPEWLSKLSSSAKNSLSLNSSRIVDGSSVVLMHPGYEKIDDDVIFSHLEDILSKADLTPKLREIEDSNRSKFGPRSIAKTWEERRESLSDYFKYNVDHDPGEFDCNPGRLRPTSIANVGSNLIGASSAGLPYMKRKSHVKEQALDKWEEQAGVYPCVLFTRTQEGGKTRNVLGYPVSDTIKEQRIFIPFLKLEKQFPFRKALVGPEAVDAAISLLFLGRRTNEIFYCVDFSAFDATISPKHSYNAFRFIASHFQKEFHLELYELFRRFVTIPVYTPEGEWSGPHGVPSGSSFTNTVDSIVQYLVSGERSSCQIQGDDGVYVLDKSDLDLFEERFTTAGLKLNPDKSAILENEVIYLQRYFHPKYRSRGGLGGVYSAYRAFARIKYLERWTDFSREEIDGGDYFSLRTITILENCKHHPMFEELVRLAVTFDRKNLAFTNEGLLAFSRSQESKVKAGVFNQYGLEKGIDKFETMKVLKRL